MIIAFIEIATSDVPQNMERQFYEIDGTDEIVRSEEANEQRRFDFDGLRADAFDQFRVCRHGHHVRRVMRARAVSRYAHSTTMPVLSMNTVRGATLR